MIASADAEETISEGRDMIRAILLRTARGKPWVHPVMVAWQLSFENIVIPSRADRPPAR